MEGEEEEVVGELKFNRMSTVYFLLSPCSSTLDWHSIDTVNNWKIKFCCFVAHDEGLQFSGAHILQL